MIRGKSDQQARTPSPLVLNLNKNKMKALTNDDTRDIAVRIVDEFVKQGLVKDCINTNDETEFSFQDIIHEELNKTFNIKEDE